MSTGHILLLGAIAGATIFLGLPVGRMRVGPAYRAGLSALATGILIFLLWDVLTGAVDPIDAALNARHWGRFSWLAALDEPFGLEPLEHLARRGARDAEHLGHPRRQRGRARGLRTVLADREREEVDRLEVLVDGMSLRHLWL